MSSNLSIIKIASIQNNNIILTAEDSNIVEYFTNLVKEKLSNKYNIMAHNHIFSAIEYDFNARTGKFDVILRKELIGEISPIVVGENFSAGYWQTSVVVDILTNRLFMTKNSIYGIYNIEDFRNIQLDSLEI